MKTYSISANKKLGFNIPNGFFPSRFTVSIKAIGLSTEDKLYTYGFNVRLLMRTGATLSFHITLHPPYFFEVGTISPRDLPNATAGPYHTIEIESDEGNRPLVIEVGFANKPE
jgi:hypothetical protein